MAQAVDATNQERCSALLWSACYVVTSSSNLLLPLPWTAIRPVHDHCVQERPVQPMRKSKGRRKVGRKKRRMRSKIRHRK